MNMTEENKEIPDEFAPTNDLHCFWPSSRGTFHYTNPCSVISLPNTCPAFSQGEIQILVAPIGWQHQGNGEICVTIARWFLYNCRGFHTLLLALPKAESALHSTLLNGSEWPNVVSEEKGTSGNERRKESWNRYEAKDGYMEERERKNYWNIKEKCNPEELRTMAQKRDALRIDSVGKQPQCRLSHWCSDPNYTCFSTWVRQTKLRTHLL